MTNPDSTFNFFHKNGLLFTCGPGLRFLGFGTGVYRVYGLWVLGFVVFRT